MRSRTRENSIKLAREPLERSGSLFKHASVPQRRSKSLFKHASEPQRRSKSLFQHASEPQRRPKLLFKHASELQTLKIAAQATLLSHLALNIAFKEAVRRSCPLQRCTLCHLTLLHFSPCMDMHGFTLVYIYIYI